MPFQNMLFRTTDLAKWGVGKGSNMTATEVDLNFWELISRVLNLETNPPTAVGISNFQIIGSQLKIFLSDGSEFGPYTLPIAAFQFRGAWANNALYFELDIFNFINEDDPTDVRNGLYMVRLDHTTPVAPAPFDPDATDGGSNALYLQLFAGGSGGAAPDTYPAIEHAAFGGV